MTNGKLKVKCIKKNKYGFIVGDIYDAYRMKSAFKNKNDILCVVDKFGEEYAYPAALFEVQLNDR